MSGLRNFSLDLSVDTPAARVRKSPVEPILVDELIDPNNQIPSATRSAIRAARDFVISMTRGEKAKEFQEQRKQARALGPDSDEYQLVANQVDDLVLEWKRSQRGTMSEAELRWVRARIIDDQLGAGPFEPLRRDKRVTEILLSAPAGGTVVEIHGMGLVPAPGVIFDNDDAVIYFIQYLDPDGKSPTVAQPILDASLPDGSRLHATHRCATGGSTFVALRRHPEYAHSLIDLINWGTMSEELASELAGMVRSRLSLVVAGGTSSGKTSTLNALVPYLPSHIHLSIIEDTLELKEPANLLLVTRRQARPGKQDIANITIREHIRAALRSRPDVILVGEVRGPEAVDALTAMNTGHEGSMLTCHANSAHETVIRLETMMSESGEISEGSATHKIASSVDIIVHQARYEDGSRRVTGIYEVRKPKADSTERVSHVELYPLWVWDEAAKAHKQIASPSAELLALRGASDFAPLSTAELAAVARAGRGNQDVHNGGVGR